ncbi:MAG: agmatinase [Deltaproteobacteria bacterium HGW-Deltaproteobacteria-22]|nr:MAG: agmatinase [Deltaproteobacteria bacterium HGW-Deltaproteobacteria-22]
MKREYPETIPYGFMGVPRVDSPEIVLLPVPYDSTTSYRPGSRDAPAAIIEASRNMETYDEALDVDVADLPIGTLEPLMPRMAGPQAMGEAIEAAVAHHLEAGRMVVTLGGEHSVTIGAARAYAARFPGLQFLHIDAHADLREEYEGTPENHACVARRLVDLGPLVEVGIRSLSAPEMDFVRARNLRIFWAREILEAGPEWVSAVVGALDPAAPLYVTLDVDVLDPSIMAATGTPEPGGLLYHHLTRLLQAVFTGRRVVGFDVVELMPIPGMIAPDFLVSRLLLRMLALYASTR